METFNSLKFKETSKKSTRKKGQVFTVDFLPVVQQVVGMNPKKKV